jgi:hypothetical protein
MRPFMKAVLGDCQFAWLSRLNRLRAHRVASPFQGEGESEGHLAASKTPRLSPLPLSKGRGEKGQRLSLSFSKLTISERYHL